MTKLLSNIFLSPILIAIAIWMAGSTPATANPGGNETPKLTTKNTTEFSHPVAKEIAATVSNEPTAEQVTQATEATEIKPGDWAYQTLQALNTKYSCPDAPTGNKTLSREEFATSLNGCIQSIEQLVARKPRKFLKKRRVAPAPAVVTPPPVAPEVAPPPPTVETTPVAPPAPVEPQVSQQDLDQLKQLVQSFSTELQGVDARIKALDAKVTELKDKSFSTTTKLVGEAIFAVTGLAGGPSSANRSTIFSDRVRLNFRSSFTGKDLLLVRLQARNSNSFAGSVATSAAKTNMTRLGFEGSDENNTTLHRLQYQLPLTDSTKVFVEAVGSELNDNYYNFNPEHQAAGTGAISRFGRFNPIYRLSNEGAGVGLDYKVTPGLGLVLSYVVPRVGIPGVSGTAPETVSSPSTGLFNGSNVIFSQLTLKPSDDLSLGLIYAHSYHSAGTGISGANGSNIANNPFNSANPANPAAPNTLAPTSANHYSVAGSVNLSKELILSAWGGLTQAKQEGGGGKADIWNYAVTLAAKDFGSKGSTLGFVVGMQPKVTGTNFSTVVNNVSTPRIDKDTSLHFETFYKYKVSDNLYITPGILMLTNPEHNAANPTEYLGTVRTTFVF
ncbi:iron uptake porin [Chamaesiphon sp. VAR_48_metabat_135_sub]|uniref:iron uptake porin n=1 Tax=Chamaesiphon sp. VAR_48_metabat_135_sub TaxID=2964699 RepID=UPI00286B1180|nr:iron uptake porin [Chamaesiphon sp. VAR_48_metabat_135_sub]